MLAGLMAEPSMPSMANWSSKYRAFSDSQLMQVLQILRLHVHWGNISKPCAVFAHFANISVIVLELFTLLSDFVSLIQPFEIIHSCVFHLEIGIGGESIADISRKYSFF